MEKRRVILDVDTGSDDAVAIIAAALSEAVDLRAVCTVAGNLPVDNTTDNTLRVMSLLGSDIPVYRGCNGALVKSMTRPKHEELSIHPRSLPLPESDKTVEKLSAPQFYVDYLNGASEPVTIVAVGPLTNLAVALMLDGGIVKNIEEIVIMGGGGNVFNMPNESEYNIWFDPEGAEKVMRCGAKITMAPLDATHKALITLDDCKRFRACGTPWGDFAAEMCEHRIRVHSQHAESLELPDSAPVHDPLCIAYLIDPTVLKDVRTLNCRVGFAGGEEGKTVLSDDKEANVRFAFSADRKKFADILCNLFAKKA